MEYSVGVHIPYFQTGGPIVLRRYHKEVIEISDSGSDKEEASGDEILYDSDEEEVPYNQNTELEPWELELLDSFPQICGMCKHDGCSFFLDCSTEAGQDLLKKHEQDSTIHLQHVLAQPEVGNSCSLCTELVVKGLWPDVNGVARPEPNAKRQSVKEPEVKKEEPVRGDAKIVRRITEIEGLLEGVQYDLGIFLTEFNRDAKQIHQTMLQRHEEEERLREY